MSGGIDKADRRRWPVICSRRGASLSSNDGSLSGEKYRIRQRATPHVAKYDNRSRCLSAEGHSDVVLLITHLVVIALHACQILSQILVELAATFASSGGELDDPVACEAVRTCEKN